MLSHDLGSGRRYSQYKYADTVNRNDPVEVYSKNIGNNLVGCGKCYTIHRVLWLRVNCCILYTKFNNISDLEYEALVNERDDVQGIVLY